MTRLIVLALLLTACGLTPNTPVPTREPGAKLNVVTSTGVIADFVRQVGGDHVTVQTLVPAKRDPHTYTPTSGNTEALAAANIVFLNGALLESEPLEQLVDERTNADAPIMALTDALTLLGYDEVGTPTANEELQYDVDPHAWMDPDLAVRYVEQIGDALSDVDEANRADYQANASRYSQRLRDLDKYIADQSATIPQDRRKLATYHDVMSYFARRYGFEIVGWVVREPDHDPTPQEIADLVQNARGAGASAVVVEPQLDGGPLQREAQAAGLKVVTIYGDALDDTVTDYESMMRRDVDELVRTLK